MAKGKPYSNIQDIINGIATGEVNAQNYEDLLKALNIKDPVDYALKKNHIEDAIKHYSRNLNAQQANVMYPSIANASNLLSGLGGIAEDISNTQAAKENTVNPTLNIGKRVLMDAPNVYSNLSKITDLLFPLSPQNSGTPYGYGSITDGDKTITIDSTGISGSGSTSGEVEKAPKKEGLQKLTSDISATTSEKPKVANTTEAPVSTKAPVAPIQIARPDYTNVAYGSQVQPMAPTQPAESPIDESYYRYLRNNGWNDFDARRQAIRYY